MKTEHRARCAHQINAAKSPFFFSEKTLESLTDAARRFAIRLRNSCLNRGQDWLHIAHVHIANAAECRNNQVNGVLSELRDKRIITLRKDGTLLRLALVKQHNLEQTS